VVRQAVECGADVASGEGPAMTHTMLLSRIPAWTIVPPLRPPFQHRPTGWSADSEGGITPTPNSSAIVPHGRMGRQAEVERRASPAVAGQD
jgi:hypothetical protein